MKRCFLLLLMLAIVSATAQAQNVYASRKRKAQRPVSVAGTYKDVSSTFEITEAADHQVSIDFTGYWPNIKPSPMRKNGVETLNVGGFQQTVPLKNSMAVAELKFTENPCVITIRFLRNRLRVTQEGSSNDCGFGFNVYADGIYTKQQRAP